MIESSLVRSSELSTLNNDEIKRIMSVIERDFKLREKEFKRIEELKKIIRQEHERIEYLAFSKEFNYENCIRCYKPFRRILNPKEFCSVCKFYVCHDCATYNKQIKLWSCKICLTLKELECLTGEWFYLQTGKKFKRCGSAKIVRELYKRDKVLTETDELDDDLGYETFRIHNSADSKDSGSMCSYVVHDKNIRSELNEYAQRLILLIDNLKSDIPESNTSNNCFPLYTENKESLKNHQQQIILEITRARTAISGPLRRSNTQVNVTYENDLRNLLIQKTESILQINLHQTDKNLLVNSTDFDQKLAKIIFDKYTNEKKDSSLIVPQIPSTLENNVPSQNINPSSEMKSQNDNLLKMNLSNESITEEENNEDEITPTESVFEDEKSDYDDNTHHFIFPNHEIIKNSNDRINNWKTNFTITKSKNVPSDNDEQKEFSTWL
ncbi:unnamed protein product [Adineta steineri]|uniref:RabBD domain-containing protein n=1 Tax=Adineta steineri TaxID=433720 RepID=A0A818WN88_9BILA|nr:unnamed protein product [Adineta steineri]CAF3728032.1 unnamed protein product [Adineta steineri]